MKNLVILLVIVAALLCSLLPLTAYAARRALETPEQEWAEATVYFAARTRMRLSRFAPAAAILQLAIKAWPKSERVDEAYYWIAFCYEHSQANDQAIAWSKAFMERYPNHPWAAQAKRRLDTIEAQNL